MGIPFDPTLGPSFRKIVKVLEIVVIMVLTFGGSTGIDLFDERF